MDTSAPTYDVDMLRRGGFDHITLVDTETGESLGVLVHVFLVRDRQTGESREGVRVRSEGGYVSNTVVVDCYAYSSRQENFRVASRLAADGRKLMDAHWAEHPKHTDAELGRLTQSQESSLRHAPDDDYRWGGHYTAIDRFKELGMIESLGLGEFRLTSRGRRIADWVHRLYRLASTTLRKPEDVPRHLQQLAEENKRNQVGDSDT